MLVLTFYAPNSQYDYDVQSIVRDGAVICSMLMDPEDQAAKSFQADTDPIECDSYRLGDNLTLSS